MERSDDEADTARSMGAVPVAELDTITPDEADRDVELQRLRELARAKIFGGGVEPTTIGRYEVIERLGAGGMGLVYLAHDRDLDRRVAVKVLRVDAAEGSDGRTRLVHEAQAMAKLSHAHVVHVYEVGRHDDNVFIAMEYISGDNLREWSRSDRSFADILRVHTEAGRGLAAAHAAGIVHRDYKPENVMVAEAGGARVLDFGLARPAGPTPDEVPDVGRTDEVEVPVEHNLTRTGALLGTPAYMAPEQLQGQRADERSDQFAFCVSLFEALYGHRPFSGPTMAALSAAVLAGAIEPVDDAPVEVPASVHAALLRGLSVSPADRFPSMDVLLDALHPKPAPATSRWWLGALAGGIAIAGAVALGGPSTTPTVPESADATPDPSAEVLAASNLPELVPTPLAGDPFGVTVHRLRNGLTVYVAEDHDAPLLTALVTVRAGALDEGPGASGVAHLLEHSLFDGTSKLGALNFEAEEPFLQRRDALARELENTEDDARRAELLAEIEDVVRQGAEHAAPVEYASVLSALGGQNVNGYTTTVGTTLHVELPSARFEAWASIESERLRNPVFRAFFSDLGPVYEELRGTFGGGSEASQRLGRVLFPDSPFGRAVIGAVDDLVRPPFSAMVEFHETYYVPNNMAIVLVGDIEAATALPVLERAFGDWEPKPVPPRVGYPPPLAAERHEIELRTTQPFDLMLAWRRPEDTAGLDGTQWVARALSQQVGQELSEAGLAVTSLMFSAEHTVNAWFRARPNVTTEAIEAAFFETLAKIRREGPSARALATAGAQRARATIERSRSAIARAGMIASSFTNGRSWGTTVAQQAGETEVDAASVQREAGRLLDAGFVAVRRSEEPYVPPEVELKTIGKVEYPDARPSAFAEALMAMPAASPEPQFVLEGRHYRKGQAGATTQIVSELDDGLTSLKVEFPVGELDDGLACYAASLWAGSGTEALDSQQFREALARDGVQVTPICRPSSTAVLVAGLDEGFVDAWPSIEEWLASPKLRIEDVERLLPTWEGQRAMIRGVAHPQMQGLVDYAVYGESSLGLARAALGEDAAVELRRLSATLSAIRSTAPVVSLAGASEHPPLPDFASNVARTRQIRTVVAPSSPKVFFFDDDSQDQVRSRIVLSRRPLDKDERVLAELLDAYLGGGMTGLLFYEVRTSRGLAYSANAQLIEPGMAGDDATIMMVVDSAPDRAVAAVEVALEVARRPIEPARFAVARARLEAKYRSRRVAPAAVPDSVARWNLAGFDADPLLKTWPALGRVTLDDLENFRASMVDREPVVVMLGVRQRVGDALARLGEVQAVGLDEMLGPK